MNREEIATFEARVEIIKKNRNEFFDETIKLSGENKDFRKQLKAAEEENDKRH